MKSIEELMQQSGVAFGTSGARGVATAMSDQICFSYTYAFIQHLQALGDIHKDQDIAIAGDYRSSTPRIMQAVALAIETAGYRVINLGNIPTPALAYYGLQHNIASIMVTGSHIPDDRNGIKYYRPGGEILKNDEAAMRQIVVNIPTGLFTADERQIPNHALPEVNKAGYRLYRQRFSDFFTADTLEGLNIGVYQHSSVARDLMLDILSDLGANVTPLAPSESFIPVDTEAVRQEDIELAKKWAKEFTFDAIISTDGDGDRPLLSDAEGNWLRGDLLGVLTAQALGANAVVTPINSNSAVEKSQLFEKVVYSQIGSPYVIEQMQRLGKIYDKVVGYEANGGFLQQSPIIREEVQLSPLPTRDAIIVPVAILSQARRKGTTLAALLGQLPERYTASDRIKETPVAKSRALIASLDNDANHFQAIKTFLGDSYSSVKNLDHTDGLRVTLSNDEVVHLRPSGNAPELRCYSEADSAERAAEIVADILKKVKKTLHSMN